jgi:heme-degrading monooxygenase HmoA
MVRHIVFWRVAGETADVKRAAGEKIKAALEALAGRIPGLRKIEVGLDFSATPDSSDVALYSEFDSREALAAYQKHPEHQAVLPVIRALVAERRLVDYE